MTATPDLAPILAALDRHERIALNFSGGKDSLACVYMLRPHLDRVVIYHNDTGDLLPEVMEVVEHVKGFAPRFVHIRGNVLAWQAEHGLPSDLVPYSASALGRMVGQEGTRIVPRYDCCYANLMAPLWERVLADGNTLVIRGTKSVDFPTLPVVNGEVRDGIEFLYPLQDWSHEQVFDYLHSVGAPICRVYESGLQAPECSRCTAWLNVGQAAYLKRHHPARFAEYRDRLHAVVSEVAPVLRNLQTELEELAKGDRA